jgi:hypothetical protein
MNTHGDWCEDIIINILDKEFYLIPKSDVGSKDTILGRV